MNCFVFKMPEICIVLLDGLSEIKAWTPLTENNQLLEWVYKVFRKVSGID